MGVPPNHPAIVLPIPPNSARVLHLEKWCTSSWQAPAVSGKAASVGPQLGLIWMSCSHHFV